METNDDDDPNSTNYDGLTHEEMKREESKFTWNKVMEKYKKREEEEKHLNLYKWVVHHWLKTKLTIPQFFGYDQIVTWPLSEEYSKWMLTFFKSWEKSIDELKTKGKFASTLESYMWDKEFPKTVRHDILVKKNNVYGTRGYDENAGNDFFVGETALTPTEEDDRTDERLEHAADVHQNMEVTSELEEQETSISEENMNIFLKEHTDHIWNSNYDPQAHKWLETFAKNITKKKMIISSIMISALRCKILI